MWSWRKITIRGVHLFLLRTESYMRYCMAMLSKRTSDICRVAEKALWGRIAVSLLHDGDLYRTIYSRNVPENRM
jgi:hypothetical protein